MTRVKIFELVGSVLFFTQALQDKHINNRDDEVKPDHVHKM